MPESTEVTLKINDVVVGGKPDDPRDAGYTHANVLPDKFETQHGIAEAEYVSEPPNYNPWLPQLERVLNEVNSDELAIAIVEAYNLKCVKNLLWRLCELAEVPAANNVLTRQDQFIVTNPEQE
jgi:hypothetical protein